MSRSEQYRQPIVKRISRPIVLFAATLIATLPGLGYAQLDGSTLLREGNELFRSGLYRAALLRYREASAQGLDSSLLHYNLGVVYYKLGQFDQAQYWLERVSESPPLTAIAAYNLGLTHRASGRTDEAQQWFNRAANQARNRSLRELAERAASASGTPAVMARQRNTPANETRKRPQRLADKKAGDFRLLTIARFGQDDNVYRAPAASYVDLSDPNRPTVTPVIQSASFMPVDVLAQYVLHNEAGDTDFIFGYQLNGDFYDSQFSNANRVSQRLDIGADIVLYEEGKRRRAVESAFFIREHQESNFDPDDGIDRDFGGVDISNRFSYRGAGIDGEFEQTLGPWTWGFDMRLERRQYEEIPLLDNYDQDFFYTQTGFEYAFSERTSLSLGLRRYRRIYDEQLSRDLNGNLLSSNATLSYDYSGVQLALSHQLIRSFRIDFDLLRLERVDEFLAYYDYTQDVFRLRGSYRPNRRLFLSFSAVSRAYDYPRAFAFNEPTAGLRELGSTAGELRVEYRVSNKLSIWAELEVRDVTSTDSRAEYSRTLSMLGVKFRR